MVCIIDIEVCMLVIGLFVTDRFLNVDKTPMCSLIGFPYWTILILKLVLHFCLPISCAIALRLICSISYKKRRLNEQDVSNAEAKPRNTTGPRCGRGQFDGLLWLSEIQAEPVKDHLGGPQRLDAGSAAVLPRLPRLFQTSGQRWNDMKRPVWKKLRFSVKRHVTWNDRRTRTVFIQRPNMETSPSAAVATQQDRQRQATTGNDNRTNNGTCGGVLLGVPALVFDGDQRHTGDTVVTPFHRRRPFAKRLFTESLRPPVAWTMGIVPYIMAPHVMHGAPAFSTQTGDSKYDYIIIYKYIYICNIWLICWMYQGFLRIWHICGMPQGSYLDGIRKKSDPAMISFSTWGLKPQ